MLYCISLHSDTRLTSAYFRDHIILARSAKNKKQDDQNETPEFFIPFDVHLPTLNYCVVYDSKTVSIIENSECTLKCIETSR